MNELCYDTKTEQWHHPKHGWKFGADRVHVGEISGAYRFAVHVHGDRFGPLIGILTSGEANGKLYGDFKRFAAIQAELQKDGGISFVFSPYHIREKHMEGYVLLSDKRWRKCKFPYPDVVYNRIPYRSHEREEHAKKAIHALQKAGLKLFNPAFFSKWDVNEAFWQNEQLQPYVLLTKLLMHEEDFRSMLSSYQTIYVKRAEGAKGSHVFRVEKLANDEVFVQSPNDERTVSIIEMWNSMKRTNSLYVAQPAILHDEHNGRKYDLRVLVHYVSGAFQVTGIGVRLARQGGIVTHVPNGGEIVNVHELERPVRFDKIAMIAEQCGRSLRAAFGHIREFSLDIGVDKQGRYVLFEANSKPMIFDEPDIQHEAMQQLLTVFREEAGFFTPIT